MSRVVGGAQTYSRMPSRYPAGIPAHLTGTAGAWCWDAQGREWLDCVSGLGAVILGHARARRWPDVAPPLESPSLPVAHILEAQVADLIAALVPSAQMVRYGKNGADACTAAVRLARAGTGRDRILTIGYHGYHDWTIGHTHPAGVPQAVRDLTTVLPYNNVAALHAALERREAACLILEPVVNAEPVDPAPTDYLAACRTLCDAYGTLLIYDEVVTFGRYDRSAVQNATGVVPDLTCLGKCLANGYPLSAVVGRADLMARFADDVFYSTTFGGECSALSAAHQCLSILTAQNVPALLRAKGERLMTTYRELATQHGLADRTVILGYPQRPVWRWHDPEDARIFGEALVANGLIVQSYVNLMLAHGDEALARIERAFARGMEAVRDAGEREPEVTAQVTA